MKNTDHHKALSTNPNALIVFTGSHCYVSASWYTETGHGSTWNYLTVQARGKVQFMEDAGTIAVLNDLTNKYEAGRSGAMLMSRMTEDYISSNVKAIAGFTIHLDELKATFKLSQNRDDESYRTIVLNLESSGDTNAKEIASEMRKKRDHLKY